MALVRCEQHGKPRGGNYVTSKLPAGYPNQCAAICGREGCPNAGVVWLKADEEKEYKNGVRIFNLPTCAARVQVK